MFKPTRSFPASLVVYIGLASTLAGSAHGGDGRGGAGPTPPPSTRPARVVNVRDAGAAGDGVTPDTAAVQRAIDDCAARGGGTVRLPAGTYLAGTVELKSNVALHLDDGATLLGSTHAADYRNVEPFQDGDNHTFGSAFVVARDAANVAIEGPGTIDGQGKAYAAANKKPGDDVRRPFLVRLLRCRGVDVSGVRLKSSGKWTFCLFACDDVRVDRVRIDSRGLSNNDGIDVDSCQRVRISGCDIDSGDDSVCLKATTPRPCRDVEVTGCTLRSGEGAFKCGTESMGDFERIRVSDCRILHASEAGVQLFSVDGSHLNDFVVSDVTMDKVQIAVMVRLGSRLKTFRPGQDKRPTGSLGDVTIRNVHATDVAAVGVCVCGIPGHPVEGLTLDHVDVRLRAAAGDAPATLDELPTAYPRVGMFGGKWPASGLYARHVAGLTFTRFTLALPGPAVRPSVVLDDVSGAVIQNWSLPAPADGVCVIRMDSSACSMRGVVLGDGTTKTEMPAADAKGSFRFPATGK